MPQDPESGRYDARFFEEWRREQSSAIRDFRKEATEVVLRIDMRLQAIESRMSETQLLLERHDLKINEIYTLLTEVDTRVGGLETREVEDANRRMRTLEEFQQSLALRQAMEAEHQAKRSGGLLRTILVTAACSAAGSVVTAAMAFLGWLIVSWIKSTNQ